MQTNKHPKKFAHHLGSISIRHAAHDRSGFTLVELVLVLALITILSTIAMRGYSELKDTARVSRCMGEIRGIEKEIIARATETGSYPATLAAIGLGNQRDPWGRNYVYLPFGSGPERTAGGVPINNDFDLYSMGVGGESVPSIIDDRSQDDIIRGRDGSFVGLASKY